MIRGWRAALLAVLAWTSVSGARAEAWAAGLIVKLKEPASAQALRQSSASVVKLQASALPAEGTPAQARRLSAALSRVAVAHRDHRATAFAARAVRYATPQRFGAAQRDAEALRQHPDVEWVVVDEMLQAAAVAPVTARQVQASDTEAIKQVWLQAAQPGREGVINAPAAWRALAGRVLAKPAVVAVLDSGVPRAADWPLADLQDRLLPGFDFVSTPAYARDGGGLDADPTDEGNGLTAEEKQGNKQFGNDCNVGVSDWHGLSVTYMLAGAADNRYRGLGLMAHMPTPVVLPVRVAGVCGAALSDLIEGMLWAAGVRYQGDAVPGPNPYPARVLNVSFGSQGSCLEEGRDTVGRLMRETIGTLVAKGVLVVASAGNGDANHRGLTQSTRPANCPYVMVATGLGVRGEKASYANFIAPGQAGPVGTHGVAVHSGQVLGEGDGRHLPPGDGIGSLTNLGTSAPLTGASTHYVLNNELVGTSYATPQVVGVAAMMFSVDPSLTVPEILQGLTSSVRAFPLVTDSLGTPYPLCDAANTAACNCTTDTCGAGILDAELAVNWALGHAAISTATDPSNAFIGSGFQPARDAAGQATQAASAQDGGGAVDGWSLLLALCGCLGLLAWPSQLRPGRR